MKTYHIQTHTKLGRVALTAATLALAFFTNGVLASNQQGTGHQIKDPDQFQAKSPSTETQHLATHHQKRALTAAERRPSPPTGLHAQNQYGAHEADISTQLRRPSKGYVNNPKNSQNRMASPPAAACDLAGFASYSGATLVNAVKAATTDCVNQLFSLTGTAASQTLNESKMVTIADALRTVSASYNGTNSGSALQLIVFLRAGYFVNWYYSADTGPYGTALKTSIRGALDAFSSNSNFGLVNDAHGEVLSEFVTLIDSASENARYLNSVVKRLLTNYNSSYNASWWMKAAVNNTFTVLFRGHQNADFKTLVQSDTSITDTLYNFVSNNFSALGTDTDYMVANAGKELGRFLQYTDGSAIKNAAKTRSKQMIDRSNVTGTTASLWVGVGSMVDYYDKANCSYYNLCNFVSTLDTAILPIKYSCSPTLRLKAQSLTSAQLTQTCSTVGGEESYFHTQVASGKIPVANDNNTQLEMVIFSSSKDYQTYAAAIYGIDTNNGGMYLEGNPADVNNQARFVAYQAEWLLPNFEIWNLTHEYIHYLDGRFNMYGDFGAATAVTSVWWIEGFAEYMSYSYRKVDYVDARNEAAAKTYSLSTIFNNDYNSGQTRVYNWGYLAVRYMFEKQRNKVTNLLGYFRPGNYSGYTSYMASSNMSNSMDSDFRTWLTCAADASLPNCGGTNPGNALPVANFTSSISNLNVNFTDTSTDSDGTIASRSWNFGDGSTSTAANPAKIYATAGTYNVTLTVTDNSGGTASTSKSITVTSTPGNVLPVSKFISSINGLTVNFTDQSTDSDGSIASRLWTFGDGSTSTATNPAKTYAAAGTYSVSLKVTDNSGGSATSSASVVVQSGTNLPECTGAAEALGKNCVRSNISGSAGALQYYYVFIPTGTKSITFTSSGGTGNADMYVNLSTWATSTAYNYRSIGSTNAESITVANPPGNTYIYVTLYGKAAFSGVQLKSQY